MGKGSAVNGYVVRKGERYYAEIYEGIDPESSRERRRWHPAGTDEQAARAVAAELAVAHEGGRPGRSSLTVAVYLRERWLPSKRLGLRVSTYDSYRRLIELHVVPHLGRVPLRQLRTDHLERLYATLEQRGRVDGKRGLSNKSVFEVHVMLRQALEDARRRALISTNPATIAHPPKRRPLDSAASGSWMAEQLRTFLDQARSNRLFATLWLAAYTGMRRSEVLGLRVGDLDLCGQLSVNRGLVSVGYELHETRGKTRHSRRRIDLDRGTVEVVRQWLVLREGEELSPGPEDYLFAHPDGTPIHPQVLSDCFEKLVKRSGLPRIRLHDLRHTHATLLLKARVPIKVVSERLGHSTPGFTMATYQHVLPGMQAEAAMVFAELLAENPSTAFHPVEVAVEETPTREVLAGATL